MLWWLASSRPLVLLSLLLVFAGSARDRTCCPRKRDLGKQWRQMICGRGTVTIRRIGKKGSATLKGRGAVAVILVLLVTACASLWVKTSGTSGPVAWQAVDMKMSGKAVLGQYSDIYSFVLVLKGTSGSAITFTRIEKQVYTYGHGTVGSQTSTEEGSWNLPANGELRLGPFGSRQVCIGQCGLGSHAPRWKIVLSGKDEGNHDIRLLFDIALPYEPR